MHLYADIQEVPSSLEKPQEGVCDSDYQECNTGSVCTLTTPCASRKRGREPEEKKQITFQFVQLQKNPQVSEKGELGLLITMLYLQGHIPNYAFACV